MRNRGDSRIQTILRKVETLPLFTLDDLASMETDKTYLKILFSRHQKLGSVVRLKKGVYVTKEYIHGLERSGKFSTYVEFLSGVLYSPSYLSGEYILHRHGVITEFPVALTAVSTHKTTSFTNQFGHFRYQSIAPALFGGFETKRDGEFQIFRASLAKALFDYLYFRKQHLAHREAVAELRLNMNEVNAAARRECMAYATREGSDRMKNILRLVVSEFQYLKFRQH